MKWGGFECFEEAADGGGGLRRAESHAAGVPDIGVQGSGCGQCCVELLEGVVGDWCEQFEE